MGRTRWTTLAGAVLLLAGGLLGVPAPTSSALPPAPAWDWPLRPGPSVSREFRRPPSPWTPGHRGVDLAASAGQVVLAPADGVVTYAGTVVDRGVLTVTHGVLRTSLEPVVPLVAVGSQVRRGDVVARVATTPGHCAPATCLHWGVRRGETYLDPLRLLRRPEPPVLLPTARRFAGRVAV